MSKHFQLIWQQHNYCAFRPLPMTTAVFSKRSPAGLWLTSEENALMTAVALCFSWDLCTVLHDWVRAGQSNGIPMDLWFMGFFPGLFFFYQNVRYFLWLRFCKCNLRTITTEEGVVGVGMANVFARHVHTNRWDNVCMASEESLSLFNLSRGKMSPGWANSDKKQQEGTDVLWTLR